MVFSGYELLVLLAVDKAMSLTYGQGTGIIRVRSPGITIDLGQRHVRVAIAL